MHFQDFDNQQLCSQLSGERFRVVYELFGSEKDCRAAAHEICVEQTVEFPESVLPAGDIPGQVVGRIEAFFATGENTYQAEISYAAEIARCEFTQLLNVIFGNFSIKPGVRVFDIRLSPSLLAQRKGPRFGIPGIRALLQERDKPILATALKPLGLSSKNFANVIRVMAENGIQIIKDDHGLADQEFSPFRERVRLCGEAIRQAYEKTGLRTLYVPNISAPFDQLRDRALYAKEQGAGALMIAPGLVGLDALRAIVEDDEIALPVFSHPSFSGSYVVNRQGFTCRSYYGQLLRLAGADAVIYPNYGGRFSFSVEECVSIAETCRAPMGHMKPTFVCPAGGMKLDRVDDMLHNYGNDVLLLIGGGLFTCGDDLAENCRRFRSAVDAAMERSVSAVDNGHLGSGKGSPPLMGQGRVCH